MTARQFGQGFPTESPSSGGGGGGTVDTVVAGTGIDVDATDPANPVVSVESNLAAINSLTSAADKGIQFTGSGTAGTFTLTTAGKALLDDADAAAQRTTLGVGTADSPQFAGVNVGNASDTTITRASAGVLAVEGATIYAQGGALGTPASGTLTNCTGGAADKAAVPLSSKSAAYTTVLSDANTTILHPSSDNNARTFTIDSNANVAYPVGTMITFVNRVNTVTIAITSDTMYLAGAGTTGSRTLAAYGVAVAIKTGTTEWVISGTGLT